MRGQNSLELNEATMVLILNEWVRNNIKIPNLNVKTVNYKNCVYSVVIEELPLCKVEIPKLDLDQIK
ncbi:MAG TPA: hypothetical protein V6C58_08185 [Allocoleopsis sp.]